jgi:hypothetical protein
MLKFLTWLIIFISFSSAGFSQEKWQEYTSADKSYSFSMPLKPEITESQKQDANRSYRETVYLGLVDKIGYKVAVAEFPFVTSSPDVIEKALIDGQRRIVERQNGKLIADKRISYEGYRGREYKILIGPNGEMIHRIKAFSVRNRHYEISYLGANTEKNTADAEKFFNSFKINFLGNIFPTVQWENFTSEDGRFSALFPGKPEKITFAVEMSKGKMTDSHILRLVSVKGTYLLNYFDFPMELKTEQDKLNFLAGTSNGYLGQTNKIISQEKIYLDGNFGIDVTAKNINGKIYVLMFTGTEVSADGLDADKFINSFTIK